MDMSNELIWQIANAVGLNYKDMLEQQRLAGLQQKESTGKWGNTGVVPTPIPSGESDAEYMGRVEQALGKESPVVSAMAQSIFPKPQAALINFPAQQEQQLTIARGTFMKDKSLIEAKPGEKGAMPLMKWNPALWPDTTIPGATTWYKQSTPLPTTHITISTGGKASKKDQDVADFKRLQDLEQKIIESNIEERFTLTSKQKSDTAAERAATKFFKIKGYFPPGYSLPKATKKLNKPVPRITPKVKPKAKPSGNVGENARVMATVISETRKGTPMSQIVTWMREAGINPANYLG
jgi:hypothetical protein